MSTRYKLSLLLLILTLFGVSAWAAPTVAPGPYYALPAWDQSLPVSIRFIVLSNMESLAVLDRETGLVWERRPGWEGGKTWPNAMAWCDTRIYGRRMGWRLPTAQEMSSLMGDVSPNGQGVALQPGHPFDLSVLPPQDQLGLMFWTSTRDPRDPSAYWAFEIVDKNTGTQLYGFTGGWRLMVWCVRGPGGESIR